MQAAKLQPKLHFARLSVMPRCSIKTMLRYGTLRYPATELNYPTFTGCYDWAALALWV